VLRSLVILVGGGFITAYYVVKICFLSTLGTANSLCNQCDSISRSWARSLLKLSDVSVLVEGADVIDRSNSCVLVSNHESWFDVFVLAGWLPISAKFVGKQELARIPIFGSAWQACGHVAVDRKNRPAAIQSLESIVERMNRKILQVVMFAEGTRSADGNLQSFKKGPFILAIEAGVPIIPLAIIGSREIMPKGSFSIGRGEIKVRIGRPISVSGMSYGDRDVLRANARKAVAELRKG